MFRGKKYQDAAKQIEKNTQYDAAEGFGLICKTASAKFDETVELHVKLTSRSAAPSSSPTAPARTSAFSSSPRATRLRLPRLPALTMSARWTSSRRSRRKTGSTLTW